MRAAPAAAVALVVAWVGLAHGAALKHPGQAALTVNHLLADLLDEVRPEQLSSVDAASFAAWTRDKALLSARQKQGLLEALRPAIANGSLQVILVSGAQETATGLATDVVLVRVPKPLQQGVLATNILVLFQNTSGDGDAEGGGEDDGGDDNEQDKCGYYRCDNAGTPTCVHATRFAKECPDDECSSDSDCGGGGDGAIDVFETQGM
ncbi:MAG: hypothetical protein AB1505_32500 [Candidatus Latescibacterota bacterium]